MLVVDANEYLNKITPAFKRSRLAPFWNDITKLRGSNCTLGQVCEFLVDNGVQISIAGLSQYIKRHEVSCRTRVVPKNQTGHQVWNSTSAGKVEVANNLNGAVMSGNPLRVLSGSRIPGEFSPVPTAKIEFN
jgi:hypothetical protein